MFPIVTLSNLDQAWRPSIHSDIFIIDIGSGGERQGDKNYKKMARNSVPQTLTQRRGVATNESQR
jgi:hypothetical protein